MAPFVSAAIIALLAVALFGILVGYLWPTFGVAIMTNSVSSSVMQMNRSAHTPVSFLTSLSGFALR